MQLSNWTEVLEFLRKEDPASTSYYMLSKNKETDDEERSKFLTLHEAIKTAEREIAKENLKP